MTRAAGDDWPELRKACSPPTSWSSARRSGSASRSVAKRVLERMDALLDETGRIGPHADLGKVALVAVVGNEDGAHHVSAELFQALERRRLFAAGSGMTYWVGEAMNKKHYKQSWKTPKEVASATAMAAANAVHLATLLRRNPYRGSNAGRIRRGRRHLEC